MPTYERGPVCIRYEEAGSGFPLLVIPGGAWMRLSPGWQTTFSIRSRSSTTPTDV